MTRAAVRMPVKVGNLMVEGLAAKGLAAVPLRTFDKAAHERAVAAWRAELYDPEAKPREAPKPIERTAWFVVHQNSGRLLLPKGWFFQNSDTALACIGLLIDAHGGLFESGAHVIRSLSGRVMEAHRKAGGITPTEPLRCIHASIDWETSTARLAAERNAWMAQRAADQAAMSQSPAVNRETVQHEVQRQREKIHARA